MEEKKTKKADKLSYEELAVAFDQAKVYANQLQKMVYEQNMTNVFKRLDYLFQVLNYNALFDKEFVVKCSDEIKDILTVDENKEDISNTEKPSN